MKKAEKTFFVQNLAEELKNAKGIVLINYAGMSVKIQQQLKEELKTVKAKMVVVKNTLLKRAGQDAKIDSQVLEDSILTGQNALIIAEDDPIAPIQIIGKFSKEYEIPQIRVGIIEGLFQDTEEINKIASLPGRDIILGQLLGSLISPISGLVTTLQSPMQKLIYSVNSKLT